MPDTPAGYTLLSSMLLPVLLVIVAGGVIYRIYLLAKTHRDAARRKTQLAEWSEVRGYVPLQPDDTESGDMWTNTLTFKGVIGKPSINTDRYLTHSSFKQGVLKDGLLGKLPGSQNDFGLFFQEEVRPRGKSSVTYRRTVVKVDIPDTKLQMIINSKINNDTRSGGNISSYSKGQRYQLEGEFGDFFELFMPETTQSETLTILAPNSMKYIMVNLADYDIEINGKTMYLYIYRHLNVSELDDVISKLEALLAEIRLRKSDTRMSKQTNTLVAHTAVHAGLAHRSLRKDFQLLSILTFVVIMAFQFAQSLGPVFFWGFFVLYLALLSKSANDYLVNYRLRKKYKQTIGQYR